MDLLLLILGKFSSTTVSVWIQSIEHDALTLIMIKSIHAIMIERLLTKLEKRKKVDNKRLNKIK
jgi:hypothetical protein